MLEIIYVKLTLWHEGKGASNNNSLRRIETSQCLFTPPPSRQPALILAVAVEALNPIEPSPTLLLL